MDYVKIEGEPVSDDDRLSDEKLEDLETLEDDDIDCGQIVYNEKSRVLKFICIYCNIVYDNIEYFCQHLSEHINNQTEEEPPLDCTETDETSEGIHVDVDDVKKEEFCSVVGGREPLDDEDTQFSQRTEDSILTGFMSNTEVLPEEPAEKIVPPFDASDMIIEEIDESDEMSADFTQDFDDSLGVCEDIVPLQVNSCSDDLRYEDVGNKNTSAINTNIVKENKTPNKPFQKKKTKVQDLLRLRRKGKKVTTVKVIAVKNRIAELYDRIKNEQVKSQHILASNGFLHQSHTADSINMAHMEQETQDALESLPRDEHEDNLASEKNDTTTYRDAYVPKEVTRKIIGQTLITLIPEGTIPNTLPSPVDTFSVNMDVSPPQKNIFTHPPPIKYASNDKRAVCPACGKIFRSHFSLTIHKRIHYLESDSSVKLAHKCPDCDQLFNKLSQLKQHVESVHYPDGFVCKICNRKLSSLSLLERHMVKVHLDRPFNCQQCGKNFSDPVTYEEHIISHNSGDVFKCNICGRKYSTEFFLMEHMRNHKEQIPQTCVVCGKVTLRITQHMKIHTPRPKRLLSCSVCGKVFNFSSGLSHHFKIMHKLPRPPPKPKKEPNPNAQKRKRKPRNSEKVNKKKNSSNESSDTSFNTSGQIIEEPSEIPDEVYNEDPQIILDIPATKEQHTHQSGDGQNHIDHLMNSHHRNHLDEEDVNHKEEEAKRVIVELIQNSTYTSFFPDNLSSVLEVVTPPIAREETISAVNSIVHDC